MVRGSRSILRRLLVTPALWGWFGIIFHFLWFLIIVAVLGNADFGLHERLTAWVQTHRGPNQGGPAYMLAYGYIADCVLTILGIAVICNVVWVVLAIKRYRLSARIKRGLCPACAYPIGASPVCTECGRALPQMA